MSEPRDPWSLLHEAIFPSPLWSAVEVTVFADGDRYRVAGPGGFLGLVPLVKPAANES